MDDVLLRSVEVLGRSGTHDVLVSDGAVRAIDAALDAAGTRVVEGGGGALLPGLHDHHIHLLAAAAARTSVPCSGSLAQLRDALRSAAPRAGWVRGIGYDDAVAGPLDRHALDRLRADVPVRVQHRSGALWIVNTMGTTALGLADVTHNGVERDPDGHPTGRLWRLDGWLRERLGSVLPDVEGVGSQLASFGVTGVTDATPDLSAGALRRLASALPQRLVTLTGTPAAVVPSVTVGPRKIVVADHDLPGVDELAEQVRQARPRAVAIHCVTREALLVTLLALREATTRGGDRIEHAAVVPPGIATEIAAQRLTVVTQPSLIALRGDDYLDRVAEDDREHLWPYGSLLAAGVRVGCSSDAPYGSPDPWLSILSAHSRQARSGRVVAGHEQVPVERALAGFLSAPDDPGGMVRRVQAGADADLVLLDRPLAAILHTPTAQAVRMTMIGGVVVYER